MRDTTYDEIQLAEFHARSFKNDHFCARFVPIYTYIDFLYNRHIWYELSRSCGLAMRKRGSKLI